MILIEINMMCTYPPFLNTEKSHSTEKMRKQNYRFLSVVITTLSLYIQVSVHLFVWEHMNIYIYAYMHVYVGNVGIIDMPFKIGGLFAIALTIPLTKELVLNLWINHLFNSKVNPYFWSILYPYSFISKNDR